jgi:enterochelin esterase-like enzyme
MEQNYFGWGEKTNSLICAKSVPADRLPACLSDENFYTFEKPTPNPSKMKRLLFISSLIMLAVACSRPAETDPVPSVPLGHIERIESMPSDYVLPRHVDIWLPEGYEPSNTYSVIYMHDGQMLFDSTITWNRQAWRVHEVAQRLIDEGIIDPCIVVGVHNAGPLRTYEYYPGKPFLLLPLEMREMMVRQIPEETKEMIAGLHADGADQLIEQPLSDDYLKFLVNELKPLIDSSYSTKTGPEHTFVMGASMGGLISWYALCEYPEVFGGAGCLSTHWPGPARTVDDPAPQAFYAYLRDHLPTPGKHRIYFDYGTATLDSLYEPYQVQADIVMREAGYDEYNWLTCKFEGDAHNEISWNGRLHIPLEFLMEVAVRN